MTEAFRPCALIPTFDNPRTVTGTVEAVHAHLAHILLIDDGSGAETRAACEQLADRGLVRLHRRPTNGGKGAAVRDGFELAQRLGYTHAFQIDGDGQHDIACMPAFLDAARQQPDALVLGFPVYGETAPRGRVIARRITDFWVALELAGKVRIRDAMIGFRVYPLDASLAVCSAGKRMDFDIEIVVLLARHGTPVVNLPVGVRYLETGAGGVSHFRLLRDNLGFCRLHARLCIVGFFGWAGRLLGIGSRS
jgi:glycosyltransferase involved in cell wall biosynthesis